MPPRPPISPRSHATQLLQTLSITKPAVPVDRVAKHLGAKLRFTPLDDEISGMIHILESIPIIGINSLHHPNRQRFTIAHELGHLVMHKSLVTSQVHVDKGFAVLMRDEDSSTGQNKIEVQANQFASELLMPRSLLEPYLTSSPISYDDDQLIESLAKRFRVSKQAMGHRIVDLTSPWR